MFNFKQFSLYSNKIVVYTLLFYQKHELYVINMFSDIYNLCVRITKLL